MADLTQQQLDFLNGPVGAELDASIGNGVVFSRKEVEKVDDDSFRVFHGISDAFVWFTRKGMEEVFRGERDIWEGDDDEANAEEEVDQMGQQQRDWADSRDDEEDGIEKPDEMEDDGDLKCPGCGWRYGHLYSMDMNGPEDAICRDCMDDIGINVEDADEMRRYGVVTYYQETGDGLTEWLAVEDVGYPGQTAYVDGGSRGADGPPSDLDVAAQLGREDREQGIRRSAPEVFQLVARRTGKDPVTAGHQAVAIWHSYRGQEG